MEDFPDFLQKITHSGEKKLDQEKLKKLDELVGLSAKNCKQSYQHIMKHLEKKHSEVRYSTLLVCDHLVRSSKVFRTCLIGEDLTTFLELTMGINKSRPLPPPKSVAKELRNKAISVIYKWHEDFGKSFVELSNAYFFLKDCYKVDFKAIEKEQAAEKIKAELEQRRAVAKKEDRLKKALNEFKSIQKCLVDFRDNCISLLVPTPEDFFLPVSKDGAISSDAGPSSENISLRAHGVVTAGISIPLQVKRNIPKLVINEDNQPIVESARDIHSQLSKNHIKRIAFLTEVFADEKDHAGKYQTCKLLNEQLKRCLAQYEELGLKRKKRSSSVSSDEDDFEEVEPKEGYEEKVKEDLLTHMVTAKPKVEVQRKKSADVKIVERKEIKPVKNMPKNIEDWEKKNMELPPVIVGIRPDNSQVWIGPSVEDDEVKVPVIESCPVEYSSAFEPVKWACRAPLPNGSLCPRKDRVKCPFHGKILPRDDQGRCTREEDAKAEEERKEQQLRDHPEWQDPKLLAELKRTTGIDLEMPKKGKRKKKAPEFPGLTDISAKKDSPRKRLARKVLTKSELRQLKSRLDIDREDRREQEFYLSSEESTD
ncbi:UV-stimulated scaffold protein A-like isoform X2 [Neocloeon triangulifer]|uniref:UV-stimulated scaffold protein A-like isoform X2 n=1 Tax=Neocloeon triangulifer TaxID=2078957 RepID=UPI00286F3C04|nr:UV-stimulated scaffold protein A-like isoform X2 [Neocloeon triangulifer]